MLLSALALALLGCADDQEPLVDVEEVGDGSSIDDKADGSAVATMCFLRGCQWKAAFGLQDLTGAWEPAFYASLRSIEFSAVSVGDPGQEGTYKRTYNSFKPDESGNYRAIGENALIGAFISLVDTHGNTTYYAIVSMAVTPDPAGKLVGLKLAKLDPNTNDPGWPFTLWRVD